MPGIDRENDQDASVALTNSASTSGRINMQRYAGGGIIVTALDTGVTINWYVALSAGGTAYPLYVDGAASTTSIAASRAYPIPDGAFAFPFVVPVLNDGTATITVAKKA